MITIETKNSLNWEKKHVEFAGSQKPSRFFRKFLSDWKHENNFSSRCEIENFLNNLPVSYRKVFANS